MYSDTDLERAVAAGVVPAEVATALRQFVAERGATPLVDEEQFRLITGFNDIFVAIAGVLLLVAVGWIGGELARPLGGIAVALTAWGLSEYFTRVRRMALPSILFLLAFVGGVFAAGMLLLFGEDGPRNEPGVVEALKFTGASFVAAGAAFAHWRRFRVPITVAAGAGALVAMALGLLVAALPGLQDNLTPLMFVAGLGVFAAAMWWDMSDRERVTRRSDVAFWLHLLAAPLIVHPVFNALGVLGNDIAPGNAALVLLLYVLLGLVALAVDRRALMVSALAYVLYALSMLFKQLGAIGLNVALTALVIGSALLLLSAFWHSARAMLLGLLPAGLRDRLPVVGLTPGVAARAA
jgi:hypothetical protein